MRPPPSIFNDVIGPVMRGPSSSHSAAAVRIGRLARDLCGGAPERVLVEFDTHGSLPTTHQSQGSDMGLFGGLLGYEADDERLPDSPRALRDAGIALEIRYVELHDPHPNTYRLSMWRHGHEHRLVAISTGGGMIEVIEIDRATVSLSGDQDVTVVDVAGDPVPIQAALAARADSAVLASPPTLVLASARGPVPTDGIPGVRRVRTLRAVLPVQSRPGLVVPFLHAGELLEELPTDDQTPLSQFAIAYEAARGDIEPETVFAHMRRIRTIIDAGIQNGLAGTDYADRILPRQSHRFRELLERGELLEAGVLNRAILYVTALMETKSSMGVIVAAPTAGSCATFPGTCAAAAEQLGADEERTLRAMLAAGLVGVFVATRSSFAAEVGGCQAETGAGAAMAAAALVELMGGATRQALSAASHALQNVLGLVCDPIANRVEAPCLGRNIAGAANAIACANMAMAGYDHLVPLDEVLDAHRQISERMARELRCTALGGLSITPTSKAIEAKLRGAACDGCG